MLVGQNEATALVHVELDPELPVLLQREEVMVRIQDLDRAGGIDHGGGHRAGLLHLDLQDRLVHVVVHVDHQGLQVLDDLVDVLDDPWMVWCSCTTPSIRKAHTAAPRRPESRTRRTGIPERVTEAPLEGLDHELADRPSSESSAISTRSGSTSPVRSISTLSSVPFGATAFDDASERRHRARANRARAQRLLRVELHDELFLGRQRDVLPRRLPDHPSDPVLLVQGQPLQKRRAGPGLEALLDGAELSGLGLHGDLVTRRHLIARNVDDAAVHLDMPMPNQLASRRPAGGEAHAEDDVVQPGLQGDDEVLTRDARSGRGPLEEVPELLLVQAVDPLHLLLLTKLDRVVGLLAATGLRRAVLARRVGAPLDGALLGVALLPFRKSFWPSRRQSLQTGPV